MVFIHIQTAALVYLSLIEKNIAQSFGVVVHHIPCIILIVVVLHPFCQFFACGRVNISNIIGSLGNAFRQVQNIVAYRKAPKTVGGGIAVFIVNIGRARVDLVQLVALVCIGIIGHVSPCAVGAHQPFDIAVGVVSQRFFLVIGVVDPQGNVSFVVAKGETVQPVVGKTVTLFRFPGAVPHHGRNIAVVLQRITAVQPRFGALVKQFLAKQAKLIQKLDLEEKT